MKVFNKQACICFFYFRNIFYHNKTMYLNDITELQIKYKPRYINVLILCFFFISNNKLEIFSKALSIEVEEKFYINLDKWLETK